MNSQVFREYDIRGIVADDFDDDFVIDLGRGYATLLHRAGKKTITLGRDCRLSSDRLRDALAEGLLGAGIDVVDIGPRHRRPLGEESRPLQFAGCLVQPHCRGHHLVVPRLGLAGYESVCSPTGNHVTPIGRPDRPGQPGEPFRPAWLWVWSQ